MWKSFSRKLENTVGMCLLEFFFLFALINASMVKNSNLIDIKSSALEDFRILCTRVQKTERIEIKLYPVSTCGKYFTQKVSL